MKVSVIGLGYVGAVLASGLARAGHHVLGVDVNASRVAAFGAPENGIPIYEPGLAERLAQGVRAGRLTFRHPDDLDESLGEAAVIATGTPPLESGAVDMSQVRSAIDWIKSRRPDNLVVVMKSTVPPGTGSRIARELAGHGIRYASNPEFLREGRAIADWDSPDRVVIGAETGDHHAIDLVKRLHDGIDAPIMVTDVTSAEMIKYASNAFLATRISFINEIAALCERVGASIDSVSEGMAMDARTGARIHAGVGYGGSCFPKDVRALDYLALTSGAPTELLRSVISVNNRQQLMPLLALRERFNGALGGLRVAVLGLAFKPQTDDVRGAPSLCADTRPAGRGRERGGLRPPRQRQRRPRVAPGRAPGRQPRRRRRRRASRRPAHRMAAACGCRLAAHSRSHGRAALRVRRTQRAGRREDAGAGVRVCGCGAGGRDGS